MTDKYFVEYTGIEVKHFKYTLLQHMGHIKKSVGKRTHHQRQYDRRDTSSKSGDDTYTDNVDIKLVYDEEPMAEENETLKKHYKDLYDSIKRTKAKTIEQTTSLIAQNVKFKAQLQEKGFTIAALKKLRKLKGNIMDTKFSKPSVLRKPILQPLRNQSVVRQPNAFKSERPKISKPRFASQVDVKNDLSKPVTQHYLPKGRESAFAKPDHVIASSE
nr:hypothetical protein [Tanacetum cinerariifolium]